MGRCPGDLQVKAPGIGVQIQNLSGKVQSGAFLRLHGFGVHLRDLYAPVGDDGLLHRALPCHGEFQVLEGIKQPPALFLGDLMHRGAGGNFRPVEDQRHHVLWQQAADALIYRFILLFGKIPEQPGVQLLFVQCGLQVQLQRKRPFFLVHMGAGAENNGAGHAVGHEQRLAKVLIDGLFPLAPELQPHVPEGKPL